MPVDDDTAESHDDHAGTESLLLLGLLDLRPTKQDPVDGREGLQWGPARVVPASQVERAVMNAQSISPDSITLIGVRVAGRLDLSVKKINKLLKFEGCYFDDEVSFREADLRTIKFVSCSLRSLDCAIANIVGNVVVRKCIVRQGFQAHFCQISGSVDLNGSSFSSDADFALELSSARIAGALFAGSSCTAQGISLNDARIGGSLNFDTAHIGLASVPGSSESIRARQLDVGGRLSLSSGFKADGLLDLTGARVTRQASLIAANLENSGTAINLTRTTFDDELVMSGLRAAGSVLLRGVRAKRIAAPTARIRNDNAVALDLSESEILSHIDLRKLSTDGCVALVDASAGGDINISGSDIGAFDAGPSLRAHSVIVGGSLYLNGGFQARGGLDFMASRIRGSMYCDHIRLGPASGPALRMIGAEIGGTLELASGEIAGSIVGGRLKVGGSLNAASINQTSRTEPAMELDGLSVGGGVDLRRCKIVGGLSLTNAVVGESLEMDNSHLEGLFTGNSITAYRLRVGGKLSLADADVRGPVFLHSANIGDLLSFNNTQLTCAKKKEEDEQTALMLRNANVGQSVYAQFSSIDGALDLCDARVGAWRDVKSAWPRVVGAEGFTYGSITAGDRVGVRDRIDWCNRNSPMFSPQPFEQLARFYRESGDEDHARTVGIALQELRRSRGSLGLRRYVGRSWSFLLRILIGYGYKPWRIVYPLVFLLAAGSVIFQLLYDNGHLVAIQGRPVAFSAFRYTADLLLPIVSFKERDLLVADSMASWWNFGFILSGWFLAYVLVAGLAGIFKRA